MSINCGEITPWIKARRSQSEGQCVEMRRHAGAVEVRDSTNPEGPSLRHTTAEFAAWLEGAKNGDFGHFI